MPPAGRSVERRLGIRSTGQTRRGCVTAMTGRADAVVFSERLADDNEFPPPLVRGVMAPRYADLAHLLLPVAPDWAPVLRRARFAALGRNAIALLAEALEIGPGRRVLLPSYHCPSMVEPFIAAGTDIAFYRVDQTLRPVPASFESGLAAGADAVVFVHYFGFDTVDTDLVSACEQAGAAVIQDCAHAFFALPKIPPEHYAIASCLKFFPVVDGGVALMPETVPRWRFQARSAADEIRGILELFDRAWRTGALLPFSAMVALLSKLRQRALATSPSAAATRSSAGMEGFRYYHPETRELASLRTSRLLVSRARFGVVAARRRANYRRWIEALDGIAGIEPLFSVLADDEVPYVVPAIIDGGESAFRAIRNRGVPLYRWEELAAAGCPVADRFRHSVIQLPCHQDLGAAEVTQLAERVGAALGRAGS